VDVTANAAANNVDVAGYKSLPAKQGVAGTVTLAFDVRIDAGDTSSASDALLGSIQLWNGSATWDLELEVSYDSAATAYAASLSEDTPYVSHATSKTIPTGAWTHVSMTIVLPTGSGGATTATLSIGGSLAISTTVHVSTSTPIPEAILGFGYATPAAGGWSVRYDNVTLDER
jgi:hypothetical protein